MRGVCAGCARGVRGVCPVLTVAAGRAQETAETYTNRVSTGLADTFAGPSIVRAKDGYWYPHGTGESPRGCEGSTRANPMVPALQI